MLGPAPHSCGLEVESINVHKLCTAWPTIDHLLLTTSESSYNCVILKPGNIIIQSLVKLCRMMYVSIVCPISCFLFATSIFGYFLHKTCASQLEFISTPIKRLDTLVKTSECMQCMLSQYHNKYIVSV